MLNWSFKIGLVIKVKYAAGTIQHINFSYCLIRERQKLFEIPSHLQSYEEKNSA